LTLPVFLSASYFEEVPLLVIFPFAMGALSLGFGFNFGFLCGSSNCFAVLLEVPLLSLALRETSDLINHQHLMLPSLISTSAACSIMNSLEIVYLLLVYSLSQRSSSLVIVTRELYQSPLYSEV
jgi:hypothetical protein